ncbi:MAG: roadblock/LC7 domain-containing protein [Pseudomonadota bacterium]|jgi:predicted regulator of Ras-like GTPase activity (Roadblock/LC7/MglB family)
MIFEDVLKEIVERSEGVQGAVIMGMDGIAIGEHIVDPACSIQSVGIEYASAIKSIQNASRSLSAGAVEEVVINTRSNLFVLRLITDEYFIAIALGPDGNHGKARYLMRLSVPRLVKEFE